MNNKTREYSTIKNNDNKDYWGEIAKKNKTLKVLTYILVLSITLNVFGGLGYRKRDNYVNSYHHYMVSYTKGHIANAHRAIIQADEGYETNQGRVIPFIQAAESLRVAAEYIGHYSIYYTFNSRREGYGGNALARDFFGAYSEVLAKWAFAIQNQDQNSIPTEDEIKAMREDITNIAEGFSVYHDFNNKDSISIEKLSFYELSELLTQLAKETRTEDVNRAYKTMFPWRYVEK